MSQPVPVPEAKLSTPRLLEAQGAACAAAAEWDRLGLPYEAGLALTRVRGNECDAAFTRAIEAFAAMEARPAAALVRALAEELGVAIRRPKQRRGPYQAARQHPLGLTRQEQQVLILIAQGLPNKEVARRLSRSPRTIEHQVSSLLGKFNAANRMEVLLRLRGEPWLLPAETPEPAKPGDMPAEK
jgi:DNA-binding CsgD family transcriptional regulator